MATEIVVPELGESIYEATVSRWLKQEGEQVAVGDAVVELETDKVNLEVGAESAGVLAQIKAGEGEDVEVGAVLGLIEPDGADGDTSEDETSAPAKKEPEEAETGDETAEEEKATGTADDGEEEEASSEPSPADEKATPVARRLAKEHQLDLAEIPRGDSDKRLTKDDVKRYLSEAEADEAEAEAKAEDTKEPKETKQEKEEKEKKQRKEKEKPAEAAPATADREAREERVRMSRRRQTIARRLVEAQQTAAMLTTFNEIDMGAVMDLRQRRRNSFEERHGVRLGFMSFFVKAAIGALKQFPHLNAEIDENEKEIVLKHYYDIGIAIGSPEGLVVPVVRNAERLTFAEIEQTINDYAEKAKDSSLTLEDLRGGSFTITNGGVFGSLLSTPILNPPQVGILGLHKIEKRPVVRKDDEIAVRPMMYVALSYDHRIVDGREAVQFLVRLKELIEDPEVLLLEG